MTNQFFLGVILVISKQDVTEEERKSSLNDRLREKRPAGTRVGKCDHVPTIDETRIHDGKMTKSILSKQSS